MYCSLPGSSVLGIFQARVLEWVVISFSRGSSQPRDQTQVSCIAGRRFTVWATREAQLSEALDKYDLKAVYEDDVISGHSPFPLLMESSDSRDCPEEQE